MDTSLGSCAHPPQNCLGIARLGPGRPNAPGGLTSPKLRDAGTIVASLSPPTAGQSELRQVSHRGGKAPATWGHGGRGSGSSLRWDPFLPISSVQSSGQTWCL